MQIVHQSAVLLLPAPRIYPALPRHTAPKLLCVPKIAGLLPTPTPTPKIIVEKLRFEDILRQIGPIRSREAMDAELIAFADLLRVS